MIFLRLSHSFSGRHYYTLQTLSLPTCFGFECLSKLSCRNHKSKLSISNIYQNYQYFECLSKLSCRNHRLELPIRIINQKHTSELSTRKLINYHLQTGCDMNKSHSTLLIAAVAGIMVAGALAVALPSATFAQQTATGGNGGIGGAGGAGGVAGNGGINNGGTGNTGFGQHANGGDANGGHGGNANGGDATDLPQQMRHTSIIKQTS